MPRPGRRSRWALLLPVVAVPVVAVIAAVAVWAATRSSGHPGGDPGGRILNALQPVRTVVPAGTTDVSTTVHESAYSAKCPDNPGGKSGWSAVAVVSTFRSPLPSPDLLAAIGDRLAQLGWHRTTPGWDRNVDQYRPQAEWRKTLLPGQTATATIYQLPAGSGSYAGSWHFSAIAEPPGFALPGC